MMEFTQMNEFNVTSYTKDTIYQRGKNMINAVSMKKYQKYP